LYNPWGLQKEVIIFRFSYSLSASRRRYKVFNPPVYVVIKTGDDLALFRSIKSPKGAGKSISGLLKITVTSITVTVSDFGFFNPSERRAVKYAGWGDNGTEILHVASLWLFF
jgi:hypothetical protein